MPENISIANVVRICFAFLSHYCCRVFLNAHVLTACIVEVDIGHDDLFFGFPGLFFFFARGGRWP